MLSIHFIHAYNIPMTVMVGIGFTTNANSQIDDLTVNNQGWQEKQSEINISLRFTMQRREVTLQFKLV